MPARCLIDHFVLPGGSQFQQTPGRTRQLTWGVDFPVTIPFMSGRSHAPGKRHLREHGVSVCPSVLPGRPLEVAWGTPSIFPLLRKIYRVLRSPQDSSYTARLEGQSSKGGVIAQVTVILRVPSRNGVRVPIPGEQACLEGHSQSPRLPSNKHIQLFTPFPLP